MRTHWIPRLPGLSTPDRDSGWIGRSVGLRELHRTQEGFDELQPAAARFPHDWVIRYNLACYCVNLGRPDDAMMWFKRASAIDQSAVLQCAMEDAELRPLVVRIGALPPDIRPPGNPDH